MTAVRRLPRRRPRSSSRWTASSPVLPKWPPTPAHAAPSCAWPSARRSSDMTRLTVVLLLAVLASAIYLVHTQYKSRRLFTELDRAVAEARRLETEHQRLQVEKRAQATPLRVEKIARAQLNMRTATPAITQYVSDPQGVAAVAAAAASQPAGVLP